MGEGGFVTLTFVLADGGVFGELGRPLLAVKHSPTVSGTGPSKGRRLAPHQVVLLLDEAGNLLSRSGTGQLELLVVLQIELVRWLSTRNLAARAQSADDLIQHSFHYKYNELQPIINLNS